MAGTSGCIPDFNVNFFGCLCVPRRSTATASQIDPDLDIEHPITETPTTSRTAVHAPARDRIRTLFDENQQFIKTFSPDQAEAYLAHVRETFAEVRRNRTTTYVELSQAQVVEDSSQTEHANGRQSEEQGNQTHVQLHRQCSNRHRDQGQVEPDMEVRTQYESQPAKQELRSSRASKIDTLT